jgi:hypothetical protein
MLLTRRNAGQIKTSTARFRNCASLPLSSNAKDDKKVIYPYQADKNDNGDKNGKNEKKKDYAAIGMRQSVLVV